MEAESSANVSIGQRLVGERFKSLPLIWPTLHKSLAFLLLLLVLNTLEEILVGFFHNESIADSIAKVGGGTIDQLVATSFVGLLILIPFFAFQALGDVVGQNNLVRIFLEPRRRVGSA